MTLFRKRKMFQIFLENSDYRKGNKTCFLVLEKSLHVVSFLMDFSNFSAFRAESVKDIPGFPEWEYRVNWTTFQIFSRLPFRDRRELNDCTLKVFSKINMTNHEQMYWEVSASLFVKILCNFLCHKNYTDMPWEISNNFAKLCTS